MTSLKNLSRKFRAIADSIDDLLREPEKENEKTAEKIKRKYIKRVVKPLIHTTKGFKYKPGTHWTQKPENRHKLFKSIRRMQAGK